MNIALLLLGPGNLRHGRRFLAILGVILLAAGLSIVIDASDTITLITMEGFGWVMVALGLTKLAFTMMAGGGMPSIFGFQGIVFVVMGLAIGEFPMESRNAVPWLFGVAMLLNGLYQAVSAVVIRYPLWGWFLISGIGHLVFGGLMFVDWKHAITWVVPLFLGAGLIVLGLSILRTALRVGRYLEGEKGWTPETAVRYFLDFHVPGRFHKKYLPREIPSASETGTPHGELLVHIWTPTTVAKVDPDANPVSRYVAARDTEGKYSVGHAALEMSPDVYISHCDGDSTAFDSGNEVLETLRSKDVPGVFLPSFEEEIETYMQPSVTVRFRNFREDQLRTFWAVYRSVTAYNFTNRNCSVAVSLALEAALMSSADGGNRIRTLLSLMTNKDVWVANLIRWKAREMVWTPGMMLDYALALQRVVEGEC